MGTKSFFNKQKSQEVKIRGQEKSTIKDIRDDLESESYIKEHEINKLDFVPELDFQDPANFVKYGSAKDYYVDLVDSVVQSYPYDGSLAERLNYYNGLVAIQKHEFDKNYPRFVGYADFGDESYSATLATPFTVGDITFTFGQNVTDHYVITDNYSKNLVYNSTASQVGSIELDFSEGVTLEFWMKKDFFPDAGETQNEVIFSISNERTVSDLFQVTTDVTASGNTKLYATFSKTTAYTPEFVYEFETGISQSSGNGLADGNWHHYAFAFSTSSTGYVGEFYVDGRFREKKFYTKAGPQHNLTGTLDATVAASSLFSYLGDGALAASVDEVRLWKTARNAKEIGRNYFYNVGGGGNTDEIKVNDDNPLELSLYYKFNESNTGDSNIDSVVLDYSGRLTNGVWVGYNSSGHVSRVSGSAIIQSGVTSEIGEPIIYASHPDVVSYKSEKETSGSAYDTSNLGSMYNMFPQWINDDDAANGLLIRKLVQVMSSYLDTLHAQITAISQLQDGSYVSGSNAKPNPFSKRNLISYGFDIPDVFIDPGVIEEIYFKDEKRVYEDKLFNLKNLIFQNIFNNLNYINKSKGTEKSFRNLFRCFGVDDELVRLNMYADNQEYELRENYESSQAKRNIIDLSGYKDGTSRSGVIYTFADPLKSESETGDSGYIPSSSNAYIPLTFENQFQFPKFVDFPDNYLDKLSKASLFGVHSASSDTTKTTIPSGDLNFKVYAETNTNNKTQFVLETNIGSIGTLTSSFYEDVYDNTNWTFAVRTKPREYPFAQNITASNVFDFEFYGVNYVAGYKLHEFNVSKEVDLLTEDLGQFITGSNKRLYVGADRSDITGTLNYKSNTRLVSSRVWFDYIEDEELRNHARDITNYGRKNPYQNSFIFENGESGSYVPRINTLALHWNFENITGSSAGGKFLIQDITSGSNYDIDPRFTGGEYSKYVGPNYSGQGSEFTNSSTNVVDFLFVDTAEQQLPENLYSSDLVEIREGDDSIFKRDSRPSKYYFAVETSLYDTISREMLSFFASIKDFNALIGSPENGYRPNYKNIEKLKELFFENVLNEPDLEKFVNLYKWMDGALDSVISNLIPASAKTSEHVRNIVESHILERSKYMQKYLPVIDYTDRTIDHDGNKLAPPNEGITSINIELPTGAPEATTIKSSIAMSEYVNPNTLAATSPKYKQGLQPAANKTFKQKSPFVSSVDTSSPTAQTKDSPLQIVSSKDLSPANPNTFFSSPLNQGTKQLWYKTRAERNPDSILSTDVEPIDAVRVQLQTNASQIATGSRQPYYVFRMNATKPISQNTTYGGDNKGSYFAGTFKGSQDYSEEGLEIETLASVVNRHGTPYYDFLDSFDRTFGGHRLTPVKITNLSETVIANGQNYLPFKIVSASVATTAWQQELFEEGHEIDILMAHQDLVVDGGGLQGPFTKDNVGGWMYRHNDPLLTSSDLRKEGYTFMPISSDKLRILSPRYYNDGGTPTFNSDLPYGALLRDGAAQRPVVIQNISGSNYFHDYQVLQIGGRKQNNRYYVKSNGFTGSVNDESNITYDEAGLFFFKDFTVLNRDTTGSNEFIIANRFSAPGGPEVNSFAFLDVEAAEFSVYNNLNYRNLVVRLENNKLLTRHTLTGGYDSVLSQPTASFYKPQRNGVYKISASQDTVTPIFDNSYVNYSIPRTDVQYAWVASSWIARKTGYPNSATLNSDSGLLTASGVNSLGVNSSDFDYSISSSDYSPVYGFNYSSAIRNVDKSHAQFEIIDPESTAFNSTNFIIVGDIDVENNLFTTASTEQGDYLSRPAFSTTTSPLILNAFLLSENGPYQFPTFKQIRTGEHRVARKLKEENIYVNNKDLYILGNTKVLKDGDKYTINQTPVTNKYKEIIQYIDDVTGTIEYQLGNDLEYFATTYVSSTNTIEDYGPKLNIPKRSILDTDFYKFSDKFKIIRYKEVNYPKNENQYKDLTRNRNNYQSFWISDDLDVRIDQSIINSQGYTINGSNWSMDVSPSGSFQEEKSGELMRNTGSTGDGTVAYDEVNARYAFNSGECRPKNLVQIQANTGAFYTDYEQFSEDARLIGQDETIVPEFTISDFVDTVINEYQGDFLNEDIYGFTLTGSEDLSGNHFAERFLKTEKIKYLNELKEFYGEPTAIRLSFDATKKLLPRTGFYPQQRVIDLAQQFSSSYKNSTITIGATNFENPTGDGSEETWSTALLPFWAPGVGLNSIKAGFAVEFPYKSTGSALPTGSVTHGFNATAPFESILSPSEYVELVMHIANSGSTELRSTASVNKTDGVYERMSHNFFAEVPEFFLDDLASFRSAPAATWQFEGPLSSSQGVKKFAMDIYIENPVDFLMYGGGDAFGPFPYNNHAPPGYYWNSSGDTPGEYCEFLTNTGGSRSGYTRAKIVFDPTNLLSTDGRLGKTSFSLQDIVANSTIEHANFLVERDDESPEDTVFMTLSASLDMFVQGDDNRWVIRSKWECPVLNFVDVTAETDGSETAVKGMWHQYGELAGSNARKRLNVRVDDTEYVTGSLTGSLAEAVGFEKKAVAFGKIKPRKIVEEAICAIPYYVDCETGEEKFFETPLNIFENRYSLVRRNSTTTDSFSDMIRKMDKYVLPPPYDFVHTRDRKNKTLNDREDFLPARPPFSMYFFEFNSTLQQQDLANIWQGVMPSIATQAEKQKVTLEHPIVDGELLSPTIFKYNELTGIPSDIRWKIFKVKKRASYDYYKMLQKKTNSPTYKRLDVDRFSFNYPYDQFSLVELGKMDVEFEVTNNTPDRVKEIAGGGYTRPEEEIVRSVSIGQPVQVRTSTTQQETTADREVQRIADTADREIQTIQRESESVPRTIEPFVPTIQTTFTAPAPTIEPFVPSVERGDVTTSLNTINGSTTITTGDSPAQTSISVPVCTEDDKSEYDALQTLVGDVGFAEIPREQQLRFNELAQKCPRN